LRFLDPTGMDGTDYEYGDWTWQNSWTTVSSDQDNGPGDKGSSGGSSGSKGAWPIKNKWNSEYIDKFRNTLSNELTNLNNSDETFTCDDLALETIIDFASSNNLPFEWVTQSGTFNASDSKYSNVSDFMLDVKKHSGAPDFANNANTTQIDLSKIQPGNLNVLMANGKSDPNHIQVISSVLNDGKTIVDKSYQGVTGFIAAQGNF
jgi:hypothetical protein